MTIENKLTRITNVLNWKECAKDYRKHVHCSEFLEHTRDSDAAACSPSRRAGAFWMERNVEVFSGLNPCSRVNW